MAFNRKSTFSLLLLALGMLICLPASAKKEYRYSVDRIWSNGTYSSFTSLVKYKGRFYCAFREGRGHVFDENGKAEGKIRIISSKNGKKWESVLLTGLPDMDFRDPKLSVTPDGRLMVAIGVSVYVDRQLKAQIPYVCFSSDGQHFSDPQRCTIDSQADPKNDWIWRVTWHEGKGYAIDYFTSGSGRSGLWLLTTSDGVHYQKLCDLDVPDFPNEATVRFLPESGQMAIMVRRDAGDCMGYWATADAPYTKWEWKKMPMRLGGPDFVMLDDHKVIACSRCHHIPNHCTTSVYLGDAQTGRFEQRFVLPSGGDTSYPGMIIEGDELWISYYAGHESKWPCIYLARIPLGMF